MNEEIYEALRDEPNVDMVIIAKQFKQTDESRFWEEYMRAFALESLNREAKFVWDKINEETEN